MSTRLTVNGEKKQHSVKITESAYENLETFRSREGLRSIAAAVERAAEIVVRRSK